MKMWVAGASALLLISACSASKEANAALDGMGLSTGTSSELLKYEGKSGSGDKITLKNVTLGPAADGDQLKAATLTFGGLDMEGDKPVVTSIELSDITMAKPIPGAKFLLKTIKVEGLNPVTGQFVAASFKGGNAAAEPPPFEQLGFTKISVNGLTFNADGMGGAPGKYNVALGEFSISNLKDKIFGGVHVEGLKGDFDVPPEEAMQSPQIKGTFDFGTGDIKNIRGDVYAAVMNAGMASAMGGPAGNPLSGLTSPLEAGYDELTWSGMNVDASGAKLLVSKVEQKMTRNAQGVVTKVTMPRATISLTGDSAGGTLGAAMITSLSAVGYPNKSIELYGGGDATYDPATDVTRYEGYNFGVTDGLDVKLTGGFIGLTQALNAMFAASAVVPDVDASGNPTAPPAAPPGADFSALKLVDLDLTLTDKSLVDFLLGVGPMLGMGTDKETFRADIVNQVTAMAAGGIPGVDKSVASEFSNAVAAFVKQPGTLNIKMKPATPLALADEKAGPATKTSLGFSATFTPSPGAAAPAKPN
ncbi:MAG TPA: hypothetical protein VGO52_13800 [Hyphomonadaceae bacterium]|nr:hypothetical protein [Hyphomonadaceae bacterium]